VPTVKFAEQPGSDAAPAGLGEHADHDVRGGRAAAEPAAPRFRVADKPAIGLGEHHHGIVGGDLRGQVGGNVVLVFGALVGFQEHEAGLQIQAPLEREQRSGVTRAGLAQSDARRDRHAVMLSCAGLGARRRPREWSV
jgi:hypothetical protein